MIDTYKLKIYVVEPVLTALELDEDITAASRLLLGTCAAESDMGRVVKQIGGGPALGIFQMEPTTHKCIWDNFLLYRPKLAKKIFRFEHDTSANSLMINHWYAAIMARLQYYRSPDPLPGSTDIKGMAEMYKKVYNTPGGKGSVEGFIEKYERYVEPWLGV